jgi:hypothetical protein
VRDSPTEIQISPHATFDCQAIRLVALCILLSSDEVECVLIDPFKNRKVKNPSRKSVPAAARSTGKDTPCKSSPYWTRACGTCNVLERDSVDVPKVDEQTLVTVLIPQIPNAIVS